MVSKGNIMTCCWW